MLRFRIVQVKTSVCVCIHASALKTNLINFEFVGDNFAYEARSIHYNKTKTKKAIYGNASLEDVKELNDEGIETEMMPWIEDKDN